MHCTPSIPTSHSRLVLTDNFRLLYDSPRAHRARIIAAKRMASSNSAALAEILGIPSSSSSTTAVASPSPLTTATAGTTPIPTTSDAQEEDPLQKLTTASQSVGDYLRAKLGAKLGAQSRSTASPLVTRDADRDRDDDGDAPRAGLGAGHSVLTGRPDEPMFAMSKFAAMFVRGQDTADAKEEADGASVERAEMQDDAGDEEDQRKSAKRRAKEERRREKEERRRRKEEAKSRAIAEPVAEPSNDSPIVEASIGEARPGRSKRRKHRESDGQDGLLEDSPAPSDGRTVVVLNKKQKKRDKSRKTGRDANP